jgi:hypothetical protein
MHKLMRGTSSKSIHFCQKISILSRDPVPLKRPSHQMINDNEIVNFGDVCLLGNCGGREVRLSQ